MKFNSLIITAVLLLLSVSCVFRAPYVPVDSKNLRGSGKVYFLPIGDFPQSEVEKLTSYYRSKYGLVIETLPQQTFPPTVRNSERDQVTAESAIDWIKQQNPALANNPQAVLIGLTTEDMYIERYDWQFAFGWRQEGRYAIISNARMSLGRPSAEQMHSRLRKMVTKNIGILYYKLRPSDDPRSVLYKNVGGLSELDKMGEEF